MKENAHLGDLLEFATDFLKIASGKPVDARKFDSTSFEPDKEELVEREIQWLLIHLYYLSLHHLPNLTKAWWIDSKKRVKGPIESWTQKYVRDKMIPFSWPRLTL